MEQYPSISRIVLNTNIYAYDKLDGSNIRAEWTRKTGFTKFGSRNQLIDESHPFLGEAIPLFQDKYADQLGNIFRKERWDKATVFFEFFGPSSFAGWHEPNEEHDVVLFDVHRYKQGLILPQEFNKLFQRVETAQLLYSGKPNQQFLDSVRSSSLRGMTFEGVICKAGYNNRHQLQQFKVKSEAWLEALKGKYGEGSPEYKKLV